MKRIIAAAVLFAMLALALREILPIGYDLYHYYHPVPRAWLAGETQLYDESSRGFYLPPWGLLLLLPLALLDLRSAMALMVLTSLACIVIVAFGYAREAALPEALEGRRGFRRAELIAVLAALCPYSLTAVFAGTLDAWALLGLYGGYGAVRRQRPWLLGVSLLLATVRPQLCVLTVPLLLLPARAWAPGDWLKVLAVPAAVVAATFPLFGLDWPVRWWANLYAVPPLPYLVKSTYDAATVAGIPVELVLLGTAVLVLVAASVVWRSGLTPYTFDLATTANAVVSPYMLSQSYVVLLALPWARLAGRLPVVAGLLYLLSLPLLFRAQGLWDRLGLLDVTFPLLLMAVLLIERRRQPIHHSVPGDAPDPLVPRGA